MITIIGSVGKGGRNLPDDVKKIQGLLNASPIITKKLVADGKYGQLTFQAILQYQMSIFHNALAGDGVIHPRGKTLQSLNNPHTRPVKTISLAMAQARGFAIGGHNASAVAPNSSSGGKLTDSDYQEAAKSLGPDVEVAMIRAFAEVESGGKSGFGVTGFPKIAFEGHIFRTSTKRAYDKSHPLLSYPYVKKAGPEWQKNNKNDATAVETLKAAMQLNRTAAYEACSWGMFQVMGFNYGKCGFSTIDAFVESMKSGEAGQLKAFVGFCIKTPGLKDALAKKDFVKCAKLYNGDDYGDYDKRISKAYKKYSGG